MRSYTYSPGDKVLVWRERIINIQIREVIGPLIIIDNCKRSRIVSIDQDGVIKQYSTLQIRLFLENPSMLDDSITERKIEERHAKTDNNPDEPEFNDENVQLNVEH